MMPNDEILALEIGSRAMGDLLSENGPARAGVLTKRFHAAKPDWNKIPEEWIWSLDHGAKFEVLRVSKKGNYVVKVGPKGEMTVPKHHAMKYLPALGGTTCLDDGE